MSVRRLVIAAASITALSLPGAAWAACEPTAAAEPPAGVQADAAVIANILNDANAARVRGDISDACVKYRLILSVDAGNQDALLGLGEGALSEGNGQGARAHFEAVSRVAPESAPALQGIGLSYVLEGAFTEAETPLRRSVELDPALWRSWNGLGVIADARRDWRAADTAWQAAIAAAPAEASLHNNAGMSLLQRGQPSGAVRSFDAALRLNAGLATAANNRRIALAMMRQYDAALAGVSERDLPEALNNVAVIAARNGDAAVADRLLAAAITAAPRYYELAVRNRESLGPAAR